MWNPRSSYSSPRVIRRVKRGGVYLANANGNHGVVLLLKTFLAIFKPTLVVCLVSYLALQS